MIFLWVMLAVFFQARADWTDVTGSYIVNPDFKSNNPDGWDVSGGYTVRAGCMEYWNKNYYYVSQELQNLPAGHYRLRAQGYHRLGGPNEAYNRYRSGEGYAQAHMFVDEQQVLFPNYFEKGFAQTSTSNWSWVDGQFYPNTMETAAEAFAQDAYWMSIEFDTDGTKPVLIGISSDYSADFISENWCIFSNFRLETTIDIVKATNLSLTMPESQLLIGHSMQASATLQPDNVTQKSLRWKSSNEFVATVDDNGLVTGVGLGQATITAQTIDGSDLSQSVVITVVPDPQAEWIDVTNVFLKNPRFDENNADYWNREVYAQGNDIRLNAMEVYNGTFNISQQLKGLPKGRYRLSMQGYYRAGNNIEGLWGNGFDLTNLEEGNYYSGAFADFWYQSENLTAYLYGGKEQQPLVSLYSASLDSYVDGSFYTYRTQVDPDTQQGYDDDYTFYPNNMEGGAVAFNEGKYWNRVEFEAEGEATIGVANDSYVGSNWCMFDNFKLEYQGEVVMCAEVKLNIENRVLVVDQIAQIEAVVTPENALQKALAWTSSRPDVVYVDQEGVVVALKEGVSVITAKTIDGSNISTSIVLKVEHPIVTGTSFVINEIMASNVDEYISPAYNFDGWVEFFNPTNNSISLTGLYLSDDATDLMKWQIPSSVGVLPAKGFKVIWFDSNNIATQNAPFKLDVDGGMLYVSDKSGNEMMNFKYPEGKERVSYARIIDGSDTWKYTSTPTPGETNYGSTFADTQLPAPVVDQPSQLFSGELSVNVTIPVGYTLRYTTDGTLPTMDNGETSTKGQFTVDATSIYRFRFFADGMLPSTVTSRSYIYRDKDYTLPVVSVVTDPDFIWSKEIGVFEQGPNGRPGNGQSTKCNWNMDWERPVNFSYITADGEMVLNQDVNLEMCGGWSRAWTPHSFKLKGNKELGGNKNLPYPFFDQKPFIRNRTLQIRNGGNDTSGRLKDPALQYIMQTAGLNIDCQSYQPVHEFINGQYMGMLNVREPNNKHYVYANYGWDDDEIDQFEMSPDSGYVQMCGTPDVFDELVDVLSPDAANSDTYAEICKMLDIDSYVNYMAAEFYLGGTDWPQNNVKAFRHRNNGKFRFVVFDLDGTFSTNDAFNWFMGKEEYTFDQLYPSSLGRITAQIKFVTLFKNMLQNADFRRKFIDAFCIMGGSVFEANRAVEIVNTLQDRVSPAMQLEGGQWNLYSSANNLRSNLSGRLETSNNALRSYSPFGLRNVTAQRVSLSSDVEGAQLLINDMPVPTGQFNGYLYAPATLKAVAPADYNFMGWSNDASSGTMLLNEGAQWSYYDKGSIDNANWTSPSYQENGWKQGNAPLGYGKDMIKTTLDYGSNSSNKRPTAYFRTNVQLAKAPSSSDEFTLNFTVDDGIIVYVNGSEAGRYNMPSGTVSYSTYASSYAPNNPDVGSMNLSPSLFHSGSNVIAVELHNNSGSSTDMVWDASLYTTVSGQTNDYFSTEKEISLPQGSRLTLKACYTKKSPAELAKDKVTPVRINEISGSNSSHICPDYFKKNDWIELYNTTDEVVDVEGMFLTDNLSKPEKFQITKGNTNANTKIPAHGYLLVWCDKLATTDLALHASFKIDGDGGELMLTAADKSWKDELTYEAHDANTTVGRYPDGAANVYAMNVNTIAAPNMLSSYVQEVAQKSDDTPTGIRRTTLASAANGFRVCYGSDQVIVKGEDDGPVLVEIFTTDGCLVERTTAYVRNGSARVSVAHLTAGFYVACATVDQTTRVGCKFMK